MFKQRKTEINYEQPIEDIIKEYERLGYKVFNKFAVRENHRLIIASEDGTLMGWNLDILSSERFKPTTLNELKEMS